MAQRKLQSRRYAQAVFEIASRHNELDRWSGDLKKIAVLAQYEDIVKVLNNPMFSIDKKAKLLEARLQGVNPLAMNLINILTAQGNFSLIVTVADQFQQMLDQSRGVEKAEVTSAVPLDSSERTKITEYLSKITGKKIELTEKVDRSLLGGFIARVGGKIIDGSTSNQLSSLRNKLEGSTI